MNGKLCTGDVRVLTQRSGKWNKSIRTGVRGTRRPSPGTFCPCAGGTRTWPWTPGRWAGKWDSTGPERRAARAAWRRRRHRRRPRRPRWPRRPRRCWASAARRTRRPAVSGASSAAWARAGGAPRRTAAYAAGGAAPAAGPVGGPTAAAVLAVVRAAVAHRHRRRRPAPTCRPPWTWCRPRRRIEPAVSVRSTRARRHSRRRRRCRYSSTTLRATCETAAPLRRGSCRRKTATPTSGGRRAHGSLCERSADQRIHRKRPPRPPDAVMPAASATTVVPVVPPVATARSSVYHNHGMSRCSSSVLVKHVFYAYNTVYSIRPNAKNNFVNILLKNKRTHTW